MPWSLRVSIRSRRRSVSTASRPEAGSSRRSSLGAEARACWRKITAKIMIGLGADSNFFSKYREADEGADFKSCFENLHEIVIPDCGHMMHLDQPEGTAAALNDFLRH